jgi:hypothetical protein
MHYHYLWQAYAAVDNRISYPIRPLRLQNFTLGSVFLGRMRDLPSITFAYTIGAPVVPAGSQDAACFVLDSR